MSLPTHHVSCKAALFSPDGESVLLTRYPDMGYGLPGGRLEAGESPDKAIVRELEEEVGLRQVSLMRRDFWHHEDGKIILGYVGQLSFVQLPPAPRQQDLVAEWVRLRAIAQKVPGLSSLGSYREFILHAASTLNQRRVSCKVALYSPDGSQVLLMRYSERAHLGLPGGHLEPGETPEETLRREFREEVGTELAADLVKHDFWVHASGKVVLGFTAVAQTTDLPPAPHPDFEQAEWVAIDDLHSLDTDGYQEFIRTNRPDGLHNVEKLRIR